MTTAARFSAVTDTDHSALEHAHAVVQHQLAAEQSAKANLLGELDRTQNRVLDHQRQLHEANLLHELTKKDLAAALNQIRDLQTQLSTTTQHRVMHAAGSL
jgi:hypothetical protein